MRRIHSRLCWDRVARPTVCALLRKTRRLVSKTLKRWDKAMTMFILFTRAPLTSHCQGPVTKVVTSLAHQRLCRWRGPLRLRCRKSSGRNMGSDFHFRFYSTQDCWPRLQRQVTMFRNDLKYMVSKCFQMLLGWNRWLKPGMGHISSRCCKCLAAYTMHCFLQRVV